MNRHNLTFFKRMSDWPLFDSGRRTRVWQLSKSYDLECGRSALV